ncbi:uncharacterized protein LOC144141452 isoform X2 [Haemaphysalis longicornis]
MSAVTLSPFKAPGLMGTGTFNVLCFVCIVLTNAKSTVSSSGKGGVVTSQRSARWGLFNWVEFANEPCVSRHGFSGVCLTSSECSLHGGISRGRCANGYGVCCQVMKTCGETISSNNSYFVDPVTMAGSLTSVPNGLHCAVTVNKAGAGVCQLRLNLERFDVIGPDVSSVSGVCSHDAFFVSGQDTNSVVPLICGLNHGQHVYASVADSDGPVRLSMVLARNETLRSWKIRVIQIPCGSQRLAPPGCLQYHEDPTGRVSSFNYASGAPFGGGSTGRLETGYPNFQSYSICFRLAAGSCSLRLAKDGPFGVNAPPAQDGGDGGGRRKPVANRCEDFRFRSPLQADFLMLGVQPFCGDDFPDHLETVDTGAVVITFVANGTHRPEHAGFRLRYQMVPCARYRQGIDSDSPTESPQSSTTSRALTPGGGYDLPPPSIAGPAALSSHASQQGPQAYPEPGYLTNLEDPLGTRNQIILYRKGAYKDLLMKLAKNFGHLKPK